MCNQEEMCRKMRDAALKVLTKKLVEARKAEELRNCVRTMIDIKKELSHYSCEVSNALKKRIEDFSSLQYRDQKWRTIDMLIAELEVFIEN